MLEQFLTENIFIFLLIFTRVGSGMMVLPGIGESYIPARIRLLFALWVSVLLVPILQEYFGEPPSSPLALAVLIVAEVLIGISFGWIARYLIATIHVAGMIISYQASLSLATLFDAGSNAQTTVIGNFMNITAISLFFMLGLHHLMIQGLVDSYTLFPPGEFPPMEDIANQAARMVSEIFRVGAQLAAPHIVLSLLLYLGAGIMARLMPNMQVFFVIMPLQIAMSLFLLMAIWADMMFSYVSFAEITLQSFLGVGS